MLVFSDGDHEFHFHGQGGCVHVLLVPSLHADVRVTRFLLRDCADVCAHGHVRAYGCAHEGDCVSYHPRVCVHAHAGDHVCDRDYVSVDVRLPCDFLLVS